MDCPPPFTPFLHFLNNFIFHIINTLRPRQGGCQFPDNIFKCIFFNQNIWVSVEISLKFAPKGPINNIPALVQILAWRRPGDKPLSEPMIVSLLTHICVTQPQWVKEIKNGCPVHCGDYRHLRVLPLVCPGMSLRLVRAKHIPALISTMHIWATILNTFNIITHWLWIYLPHLDRHCQQYIHTFTWPYANKALPYWGFQCHQVMQLGQWAIFSLNEFSKPKNIYPRYIAWRPYGWPLLLGLIKKFRLPQKQIRLGLTSRKLPGLTLFCFTIYPFALDVLKCNI